MENIVITIVEKDEEKDEMWSGWMVQQGERYADGLTYDEMIGLVTSLTLPEKRPCLQWMLTEDQHKARRESYNNKS